MAPLHLGPPRAIHGPPDYIGELCVALGHRWKPNELFVIFTGYFDEADTHGPAPTMILAGYVGHAYQWRQFEKKLARIQAKYGFKIFHAKDFKPRVREFSGWSDDKCDQLVADLSDLVRNNLTQGITISLTHDRYVNEYLAEPISKKMHRDSQYGACFRACLAQLLILMEERGNRDRMHVVFERGHPNVWDCERIFNDIKSRMRRAGDDVLGSFTVETKLNCAPLMVADFLAAAHSILKTRLASGTINREDYVMPPSVKQIPKGAIAMLELAPDALKALKIGFEQERQRGIDQWRARKAAKKASQSALKGQSS